MKAIIKEDTVLRIRRKVDVTQLDLSAQEGFIVSRIDGKATVKELYQMSLLDKNSTAVVLKNLVEQDVLEPVAGKVRHDGQVVVQDMPVRDFKGFIFNLVELQEENDLPENFKKEILFLYHSLGKLTHFQLLNIKPDATTAEIKRAYLKLSKLYHPDSYFRKNLGTYKNKLNRVYSAVTQAHMELGDSTKRRLYKNKLEEQTRPKESQAVLDEKSRQRYQRAKQIRQQRRLKQNPLMLKVNKAKEYFEAGLGEAEKNNWVAAVNNFRLAAINDPNNELYEKKIEEVEGEAKKVAAERYYQRAQGLEQYGQEGYFELYIKATETYPKGGAYSFKVAQLYTDQRDWQDAVPFAKAAVKANENNPRYRLLLGQILIKLKRKEEAVKHLEKALELKPDDEFIKKVLKEAKRWF